MAELQRFTLTIGTITQGGKTCTNPTITANIVGGLTVPCEYADGKIEVQIDPTATVHCIDFVIDCKDCEKCPPQVIRRCLCETSEECSDCENCIDGWCVPYCPDSKYCSDNICVDCTSDTHCPCDQVCVNGKCQCPNDKPNADSNGCCHACIDGEKKDGFCEICVGGQWTAIICPNSYPDPDTCECKDCVNSGQCPPNQCCDNGKCVCCPGYIWDAGSGTCIPKPPCQRDTDCAKCETCVGGDCQSIVCPTGYKSIGDNCCAKECDCDNPTCPEGQSCYRTDDGCICVGCSGPCLTDTDCDPACGCENNECVPNPCNNPCTSGEDCDPGCGCLNNRCVPCEGSCTGTPNSDCEQKDGCRCNGGNCEGEPCNKACIEADDCEDGCGCQGDRCTDCSTVSCATNLDCPFGCYCDQGTSKCKANPCPDPCSSGADCGVGCGCFEGHCYPCSSFDCNTECDEVAGCECVGTNCQKKTGCEDVLSITKLNDDCELKGLLTTKDCCACPTIGLDVSVNMAAKYVNVSTILRKGINFTDTRLGSTGIVNELPISGTARLTITQKLEKVSNPAVKSTKVITVDFDYGGVDDQNTSQLSDCDTVTVAGVLYNVVGLEISIKGLTPFIYENECRSTLPETVLGTLTCSSGTLERQMLRFTPVVACKTPLFTWYKGATTAALVKFREVYAHRVTSKSYDDIIDGTDGLEVCKYYKLVSDCGCDPVTLYSCSGSELSPNKLTFCQPTDLEVEITPNTCNTEICIKEVTVCSAMADQDYKLYLNGDLYGTYTSTGGTLFSGDECITYTEPVTEVKLVFPCDDCDSCTITKTLSVADDPCTCSASELTVSANFIDCASGITYSISDGTAPYNVVIKRDSTTLYSFNTSTDPYAGVIVGPVQDGLYVVTVTDALGCVKTATAEATGCCDLDVLTASYNCATGKVTITSTGGSFPLTLSGTFGSGITGDGGGNNVFSVGTLTTGTTYTLTFTDANDCTDSIDILVNCCASFVINSATIDDDCNAISVSLSGGTSPYKYSVDGGAFTSFTYPAITLGTALTLGNHTLAIKDAKNCVAETTINCTNCPDYSSTAFSADYDCTTGGFIINSYTTNPAFTNPIQMKIQFEIDGGTTVINQQYLNLITPHSYLNSDTVQYKDGTPVIFTFYDADDCLMSSHVASFNKILFSESYDCTNDELNISVVSPGVGADIYVDGDLQPTPYVPIALSSGNHIVKVVDGECSEEHTVSVNCAPACDLSIPSITLDLQGNTFCGAGPSGCCYRLTNNHAYTVNFEIYSKTFAAPCDPPTTSGYTFVETFVLTAGQTSAYKAINDNQCYKYIAIKASDPTCQVTKGFSCP